MQADPTNQLFVMIADLQALTDNAKIPKSFSQCFRSCFGLFSSWFRPYENNNFYPIANSQLAELTMYYLNLVTTSRSSESTVKAEIEQKIWGRCSDRILYLSRFTSC